MNRFVRFSLEVGVALLVAAGGAWLAQKLNGKENRRAQAEERIAAALERAYPAPVNKDESMEKLVWSVEHNLTAEFCEKHAYRTPDAVPHPKGCAWWLGL